MLTSKPDENRKRFARGQKFTLSTAGLEAAEAYRAAVLTARASGRSGLEAALVAWAEPRAIAAGDGVILIELAAKPVGLSRLAEALEASGTTPDEIRAAVGRLLDAGMIQLVPLASQIPA